MSITIGQQALIRRVVTMTTTANIVLPQGSAKGLPRYVIQASGGGQRTMGLSPVTDSEPEITVKVESVSGQYTTANDALVAALVARFAVHDRFDDVFIEDAPSVRPPLPVTDGVYSVPVIIKGRYFF